MRRTNLDRSERTKVFVFKLFYLIILFELLYLYFLPYLYVEI